jgi:hypothetical protein
MRPLPAPRAALTHSSSGGCLNPPQHTEPLMDNGEGAGRSEPQRLGARAVPADPYKAWLEQREAEREQPVRWILR